MDRTRFLIESFDWNPLLIILASVLLLTALSGVAWCQTNEADGEQVVRQVAENRIQVGMEQYDRGLFKSAEESFLRAQDCQEYLTAAEREKLKGLLEKTHSALIEREGILAHIQTASELVKQDELIRAKAHLEKVQSSEFLTEQERKLITEGLKKIGNQLNERRKQIAELYNRSVEYYHAGHLEKAREGFIEVAGNGLLVAPAGKRAEDYLVKIDKALGRAVKPSSLTEAEPVENIPKAPVAAGKGELPGVAESAQKGKPWVSLIESGVDKSGVIAIAEPVTEEDSYIKMVERKRNIRRSYAGAVVKDAVTKAQNYVSEGKFYRAKGAVEAAEQAMSKNRMYLKDELLKRYSSQLKQLSEEIVSGRERWLGS